MTLNYKDIIKTCDANITPLETNDLDSFFNNINPKMRSQIYVFIRDDLKLGDKVHEYLHDCPALIYKDVDSLPDKVVINTATSIGESAFENSSVGRIDILSNVTEVGENAFKDCKNLRQVAFRNGSFEKFAPGTFVGCSSLKVVLVPESVIQINKDDFEGCPDTVRIGVTNPETGGAYDPDMDPAEKEDLMDWYKEHMVLYN